MKVGNKIMTELNKMFDSDFVVLNEGPKTTIKKLKRHLRKLDYNPRITSFNYINSIFFVRTK